MLKTCSLRPRWVPSQPPAYPSKFCCFRKLFLFLQECCLQLQTKQNVFTKMTETVDRLTGGQTSPEHADLDRLSRCWVALRHQAEKLQAQKEEDLQRAGGYHACIAAVEALFEEVSGVWDNLARSV